MKILLSLSGGLDSATALGLARSRGHDVTCVGFVYGSKHNRLEQDAAARVAAAYGVPFRYVDLAGAFAGAKSALLATGGAVPEGHYEAESMRQTVVPARNVIFCAVLAGAAVNEGAGRVWLGVHAGDHFIYPDCRPAFVHAMNEAVRLATDGAVEFYAPFLHDTKADILRKGLALTPPVPYGLTRTCYTADATACGRCGSCQERLAAFAALGVEDPLPYVDRALLAKEAR